MACIGDITDDLRLEAQIPYLVSQCLQKRLSLLRPQRERCRETDMQRQGRPQLAPHKTVDLLPLTFTRCALLQYPFEHGTLIL